MSERILHVKPGLYAEYFFILKEIAYDFGYNLVLHGSLHRDLDLIAIPWSNTLKPVEKMILKMAKALNGRVVMVTKKEMFNKMTHGRRACVIQLSRWDKDYKFDRQYYLDISITPSIN